MWSGFAFKKRSPTGAITTILQNVPTGSGYYGVTLGGMTVDHEGRILATDAFLNRIIQIEPSGEERIVGGPADTMSPPGNFDAAGTAARFHEPRGIDVDAFGNVHVADSANHAIRKGVPFARGSTTRLANISVRGRAGTAEQTLILGFVIGGADGKPILVRGVGPGLSSYGVSRALPDPELQLYSGSIPVAGNDDWGGVSELRDLFTLLGAAPLAANSKDAALSISLMRGVYTAHVTAADGETGIALAEVFDAEIGGAAHVINLSARSQIGVGDDILIAGFVLAGSTPKTVLIRGAGPMLTELGVTSAMKDPQLALFQGSARIVQNDDWSGSDRL